MPSTYFTYKPLQNYIKNFEIIDSLKVCWNFANHLHFNQSLLPEISVPNKVNYISDLRAFNLFVIHDWELEFLISEIILNSPDRIVGKKKSLKIMKDRNTVVDHMRRIHDECFKVVASENVADDNVFIELNRIAHQQFYWQLFSKTDLLYRYYKIFSTDILNPLVESKFQFSTKSIFQIGLVVTAFFTTNFELLLPIERSISFLDKDDFEKFLSKFALDLTTLKKSISESRKYDETLSYRFNVIRNYPLIIEDKIYCPLPMNLLRQITGGLYYAICREPGFDNEYGISFQKYLMEVVNKVNKDNTITLHPEEKYGSPEKSTADIILEDSSSVLLECKTKKMVWFSKQNIINTDDLEKDLNILAEAVYQLYKTLLEYKTGKYPQLNYDENKKTFLMVVTLEEWYIGNNPHFYSKIRDKVKTFFARDNLSENLIDENPYFIFSADEFEYGIQIMRKHGIEEYCTKFLTEHGHDAFKDFQRKSIFDDEVKETFMLRQKKDDKITSEFGVVTIWRKNGRKKRCLSNL